MTVDSIRDGIVIDHIAAGAGMKLYKLLGLDRSEVPVAIMMNVTSRKLGRKDIIKIDGEIPIHFEVIGFVDPGATVNVIRNGELVEKKRIGMPERLVNEWIRPDVRPEELLPYALTEMVFEKVS